ncbi:DUF6049 family protein [Streptomyces sp. H10-C2]|uniref:DUF6049 family protein n=1 Tax=unclassified Streptomyces TaxID=2593676 RepID=UPI0024B96D92|nr:MULTISPECIES: DUF6049 family protein [unclassified Streptomyces]MDJ0340207.1 DUF6049 family protein [Streptomyces sp. PH10-H1]MDJ0368344.1 DUF6049 family protein [Streptomyces sp. H10-C2]
MGEAAQSPGTPTARPRRLRRAAALIAGASLFAGLLQAHSAPVSYAAEAGSGSRTAQVSLESVDPIVPAKDGTITVAGTVTNKGRDTITGAQAGVRVASDGPLSSRSAISAAAARTGYTSADGSLLTGHTAKLPDIPAGTSSAFSLKVPVSALELGSDGVYQLGVTLNGQTADEAYDHVLGIQRTFLPWYDKAEAKPTQFTFLWPLADRPHLAVRSDTDDQQSPIFLDDGLAAELAPGGRLQQLVELGKTLPITWAIDPDLLATIDFMTRSYRVLGPDGDIKNTTAGTGTENAKLWLNNLKSATAGHEVVALPFGDTDIASIAHHGKDIPATLGHLKTATDLGVRTVDTILGLTPTANVAWPADGAVDPSIIDVATAGGADKVIARSDSFGETGAIDYTPTSARPISGGTTAVVTDANLSKAFQGDMLRASTSTLAIQEFLSQSLMITMQAPTKQRSIVVAPQRMPTASQAQEMARGIAAVDRSAWAETLTFDAATKATADPAANRKVPGTSSYPDYLRKQEISASAFQDIQRTQGQLNGFTVILSRKDRVTVPFTAAVLRSMSNAWRGNPDGAFVFRDSIGNYLTDLMGSVHILDKTNLTLSGRSATIPVTVKNELGQAVTGLELRLTSSAAIRLDVGAPQPVTVEGGHTRSLKFTTKAGANGLAQVTAQLYTKDGVKYGDPITFGVKVTSITDTVMLVIAGGLLLLVLAGVRMYRQRKRRAPADGGDGGGSGDGDDDNGNDDSGEGEGNGGNNGAGGAGGAEPGQEGDPAADTAPENTEPPRTGEKVDR